MQLRHDLYFLTSLKEITMDFFYFLRIFFLSSITAKTFYWTWLYIWITRQGSYDKQELLTLHEPLSSPSAVSLVGSMFLILLGFFCVVLLCVLTFWVWGIMSYLRYLCLFAHSGVHHILCCVFMFCLSSSCVPNVTSVSGVSILDCPFCFF